MSLPFPGQRWMSTAEPELGLGEVLEADRRTVRLRFPASDEERVYAIASAPIQRVVLQPGETAQTQSGDSFQIESSQEVDGILVYSGQGQVIPETDLTDAVNLATADRRLLDGRVDDSPVFLLRARALQARCDISRHPAHGYLGARMDLIPHQLFIAQEVAERRMPRVLLADEVGLGKTIEACLILHRLYVRNRAGRILILVPEALIHQWFVELLRRFNLTCAIYDEERCAALAAGDEGANPFLDEHLILTSPELFVRYPQRLKEALTTDWGLLIVDEAHHLKWNATDPSPQYRAVEALSQIAEGLLLLTGTPEQFGEESHFARLRLIDPVRYPSYDQFHREVDAYHKTAGVIDKLLDNKKLTARDRQTLGQLVNKNPAARKHLSQLEDEAPESRDALVEDLLDRHGTGRAVFRNTRASVGGFPSRKVHPVPLSASGDELASLQAETHFELGLVESCPSPLAKDPRVAWLVRLFKKHPDSKFLLICRYRDRAIQLAEAIKRSIEIPMTVFHEDQTIVQRDRNAASFADPDGARLLICSEIGSEGRNFQFAHHLILYDLPMDPERIEQRIGRLDRIGQRETIHLHIPYFKGTAGEVLFRWLHEGVDAFSRPVQGGALFLETFLDRLQELAQKSTTRKTDQLITEARAFRADLVKKLQEGRDRLLERRSFRPERVQPLIAAIRQFDSSRDPQNLLMDAFDHFGVQTEAMEETGPRTFLLTPGHLLTDQLTMIPEEGKTITFDRGTALARDDIEFVSWDHPLTRSILDLLLCSETGNAAFSEIKAKDPVKPGLYVHMLFVLEGKAPAKLDLASFLPPTPLSLCLDLSGKTCAAEATEYLATARPREAPRHALTGQAHALKPLLQQWNERARTEAEKLARAARDRAATELHASMTKEKNRLQALAGAEDEIARKELAVLSEETRKLADAISASDFRLDAIRLIRVS